MKLIFNKAQNGITELRQHLSQLFASNEFEGIKAELIVATQQTANIVSREVYDVAQAHYISANYQKESPTEAEQKLDELVQLLQLPIALQAYLFWAPVHDLVHDSSGRRQRLDEHSKAAYQWQTDAEETKIEARLGIALDALIRFLDANTTQFTQWKASTQYQDLKALLVNSVDAWQQVHPINGSRHILQMLVPFAKHIQATELAPSIGQDLYNTIITKRKTGTPALSEHEVKIIELSQAPIVLQAMATAFQRLPVSVLPTGLGQNYVGDRGTTKSQQVPNANDRASLIITLKNEGRAAIVKLQNYLQAYQAAQDQTEYPASPRSYKGKKFFRT